MSLCDLSLYDIRPVADERFVIRGDRYRITLLTDRMLRLEYRPDGVFEDRATRLAFNRAFDTPAFDCREKNGILIVETAHLQLYYDKKPFAPGGIRVIVDRDAEWTPGKTPDNLGGTARTLDNVNGAMPLDKGLLSRRAGYALIDDSQTMAIGEDGWPVPARREGYDWYFFGYGRDYEGCIRDFYRLSAPVPKLPRFALGNWWSRYHKYTSDEYLSLMDRFKEENVPLSVAVIDMDWHITRTPDREKYGGGWTGYTWNRELFPDPDAFLSELHDKGLRVSMNLHPKQGIRAFDERYPAFAEAIGEDPAEGKNLPLDVSDRRYMQAYFDTVLHGEEDRGVDFWWIDWQQDGGSTVPGYDTLWMLNHCHVLDNSRAGNRGMTFSRYAGVGSHRYPLGFSGDTHITWESLDFQPYFTATASNVGYSFWSHDIGGHMHGIRDDELYARWVQLGAFSPILRLHSSPSDFISKEPWKYGHDACECAKKFLRLRHRLLPYLYTMMLKNCEEGQPLIRPMYYRYPNDGRAYDRKNEYFFGTSLIAAPITERADTTSGMAKVKVWLPAGTYIDVFTGRVYRGGKQLDCYRPLDVFPLFSPVGSVIPLCGEASADRTDNPGSLEIWVMGPGKGSFSMREDNGERGGDCRESVTGFRFSCDGGTGVLTVSVPAACDYLPAERVCRLCLRGFRRPDTLTLDGDPLGFTYDEKTRTVRSDLFSLRAGDEEKTATLSVSGDLSLPENEMADTVCEILFRAKAPIDTLNAYRRIMESDSSPLGKLQALTEVGGSPALLGALTEVLCADLE